MNVTGLAYDANCKAARVTNAMSFIASPTMVQNVYLPIAVSMLPKAVGAGWRGYDVRNAPTAIKENTWRGESTVCGLVATNAVLLKQVSARGKQLLGHVASKYPNTFMTKLVKMTEGGTMGIVAYIALACTSNYLAEAISRKFFPREIRANEKGMPVLTKAKDEDDDDHEDHDDSHERLKRDKPACSHATAKSKPEPIRHQPVTFAQNLATAAPVSNPFGISSVAFSANPAVAKPAFSI